MWRLALKNVRGRKAYAVFIVFAVASAAAMMFVVLFTAGGARQELERARRLQTPDLAVVPAATKVKGHTGIAQGPPAQGVLPAGTDGRVKAFVETEAVTAQKYLGNATLEGTQTTLIAFEPSTDFVVLPWLEKSAAGQPSTSPDGIVSGARVAATERPGDSLEVNGMQFTLSGRLRETNSFLDTALFFPAADGHITEPSWILVRLQPGTYLDAAVNRLEANIDRIEVLTRPEMLKTINEQLYGLLQGEGLNIAALLVTAGALLFTGAAFALMMHERRRELGLLKAMGARNAFILRLLIGEAAVLGGMGGLLGMPAAAVWLFVTDTGRLAGAFSASSFAGFVGFTMLATLFSAVAAGVLAALCPALLAAGAEPYAAIRNGE
ncbi:MAG: ABC transporter permease [Desulfovibrio sp.]|jgi:putative ABC transport system permease protein|nr:ABC transporter permease [Desulfovibrio sp.]